MIKNVLFVDGNRILCRLIQKKFNRCRHIFSVIVAKDGLDAVEKLKENNISLVITELQLPNMDGFALLTHLSENYPDIPVIVQTGQGTPKTKKIVLDSTAAGYIEQPFKVEDLGNSIVSILEKESEGGILKTFPLEMFIQLIEMDMKTCTIRINEKTSGEQGILFFQDGDLLDARIRGRQGKQAALEIFRWDDVILSIQDDCALKEKRINEDLQAMLFDAIRLKDEAADNKTDVKEDTDKISSSVSQLQENRLADIEIKNDTNWLLEDMLEIEDVQGVFSISFDGKPVMSELSSHLHNEIEDINWSSLFQTLNGIHEAELIFENRRFFLRRIEKGYLIVVIGKTVPVEMVRLNCDLLFPNT